jgi:hypothetical protein
MRSNGITGAVVGALVAGLAYAITGKHHAGE